MTQGLHQLDIKFPSPECTWEFPGCVFIAALKLQAWPRRDLNPDPREAPPSWWLLHRPYALLHGGALGLELLRNSLWEASFLSCEVTASSGHTQRADSTRVLEPQNVTRLSQQPLQFKHKALFSPGREIGPRREADLQTGPRGPGGEWPWW